MPISHYQEIQICNESVSTNKSLELASGWPIRGLEIDFLLIPVQVAEQVTSWPDHLLAGVASDQCNICL